MSFWYIALSLVLLTVIYLLLQRSTRGPLGVDPRVRLGPDGFVYEDPRTPIGWEVSYELEDQAGARRRGTFELTVRKMWIYTGTKPVGVRILDAAPFGNRVGPGQQWLPGQKVGGHKSTPHVGGHVAARPSYTETESASSASGEWGLLAASSRAPDYPETYSTPTDEAGADYRGGGGESGGGGSSVSWGEARSGEGGSTHEDGGSSSSWDGGTTGGNDSYPSAY